LSVTEQIDAFIHGETDVCNARFPLTMGGTSRHFELYATAVGEHKGENREGRLFVFRDRTEEEKIDTMKNELISVVSHELRTPLAGVFGFVELLLNREMPREKQKKYLHTIHKEAERLSSLIGDFLDLQRMSSGNIVYRFDPVDIARLVREVLEQWQGKHTHTIHLHAPEESVYVRADADRMCQVVHNLISNAIKYSPDADAVNVVVQVEGDRVLTHVQDYGLGIPEEARDKMFTKFYRVDNSDRRKIGGTGLGLAIVKEIVEAHQGDLTYTSEMGKGSTFTFVLDRAE
jgi:signal transduction histidine kinase